MHAQNPDHLIGGDLLDEVVLYGHQSGYVESTCH